MLAKGSLLWASNPAEIRIISGLNLSTFFNILLLNISKKSSEFVPAEIGALNIFPTPVSFSKPVPGNKGCSWIEP